MTTDVVVRAAELRKRYRGAKRDAVDGLSFEVGRGTVFGLLGPNGAGKTTTLSMLAGLLEPDGGALEFFGAPVTRAVKRRLGVVPQEIALFEKLTGAENLAFFGKLYDVAGDRLEARAAELLELVGLTERRRDRVSTYSTGMKRRLNLAVGLVHEPEVLLLDEPTVGIDPQSRNRIYEAIHELKASGLTILYTTHYMDEASNLCDRLLILDAGRVTAEGEPAALVREQGAFRLEFEVGERGTDEAAALSAVPEVVAVEHEGDLLVVRAKAESDVMRVAREVVEAAGEAGWKLALRAIREPTLESLFLDLTGKRLRD